MARLSDRITTVTENPVASAPAETYYTSARGEQGLSPSLSPFMRCPLPPVARVSPDSLRQFYRGGILPQKRLLFSDQS